MHLVNYPHVLSVKPSNEVYVLPKNTAKREGRKDTIPFGWLKPKPTHFYNTNTIKFIKLPSCTVGSYFSLHVSPLLFRENSYTSTNKTSPLHETPACIVLFRLSTLSWHFQCGSISSLFVTPSYGSIIHPWCSKARHLTTIVLVKDPPS